MTIEKAIQELESMKRLYAHVRKNDGEWEAVEMAISALFAQQEVEKNEPLTYEDLQKMDGEPVWLSANHMELCCDIVCIDSDHDWPIVYFRNARNGAFQRNGYGKTWIAYRHPPKEKENE